MTSMNKRVKKATVRFLEARGYTIVKEYHMKNKINVVAIDNDSDALVFIRVKRVDKEFGKDVVNVPSIEKFMIEFLQEHQEYTDMHVRYDVIKMIVLNDDTDKGKAFIRHTINAMNHDDVVKLKKVR